MIWGYHVAASTLKIILFNFCRGTSAVVLAGSQKADIKIKHCKFVQFAGLPEGLPLQLNPCKETHNAATMATPFYT